jgi:SAM-dependent methyltransferase
VTRPYEEMAKVYDAIYQTRKNYLEEATKVWQLTRSTLGDLVTRSDVRLLDVACGTGLHLQHFAPWFGHVEGLDLNEEMLAIARARLPDVPLHHGNMMDFDLGREFDVITCLFSAIGHMTRYTDMCEAIITMASHLRPSGVLFIEPWLEPDAFRPGTVHAYLVDTPEMKIAHINVSKLLDRVSIHEMHYLVGRPTGITSFVEVHELGLYTHEQYRMAFKNAGLTIHFDQEGLAGRGLYTGIKPT